MLTRFLFLALAAVSAAGCGLKAQTYVMTKERVDIEKPANANVGYLAGSGTYQEPEKKTRKVYVLEVSKPASGADKMVKEEASKNVIEKAIDAIPPSSAAAPAADQSAGPGAVKVPVIEDVESAPASGGKDAVAPGPSTAYTVQKDDTLQKIAKKVYGSYSKWVRIYDANKDKLKNPNFVKPGTVLTIPAGD